MPAHTVTESQETQESPPPPPLRSHIGDKNPACGSHTGLCQALGPGLSPPDALRGLSYGLADEGSCPRSVHVTGPVTQMANEEAGPSQTIGCPPSWLSAVPSGRVSTGFLLSPKFPEPSTKLTPHMSLQGGQLLCDTRQSSRLKAGRVWKGPGDKAV